MGASSMSVISTFFSRATDRSGEKHGLETTEPKGSTGGICPPELRRAFRMSISSLAVIASNRLGGRTVRPRVDRAGAADPTSRSLVTRFFVRLSDDETSEAFRLSEPEAANGVLSILERGEEAHRFSELAGTWQPAPLTGEPDGTDTSSMAVFPKQGACDTGPDTDANEPLTELSVWASCICWSIHERISSSSTSSISAVHVGVSSAGISASPSMAGNRDTHKKPTTWPNEA